MASESIEALIARINSMETLLNSHSFQLEYLSEITKPAMKRDILLTAAEILKRSIEKKGHKGGETYQFSTKVVQVLMKVWNH